MEYINEDGSSMVLQTDEEVCELLRDTKFIPSDKLNREMYDMGYDADTSILRKIEEFVDLYESPAQDTAAFAVEAYIVIRNILDGKLPVKLQYLTDFPGEEKMIDDDIKVEVDEDEEEEDLGFRVRGVSRKGARKEEKSARVKEARKAHNQTYKRD